MPDSKSNQLGWESLPIICQGGLLLSSDALTQGTQYPGSAIVLQNFEPSLSGGYRRLSGFTKWDSTVVPGTGTNPVLGVKVAFGGVLAVRKLATDNRVYFSSGSGWGTKLNAAARTGSVTKARFIAYSITEPVVVLTDGVNPAWKWNGTTETTLNGAGAPSNPKYAAMWRNRLILAGYGNSSKITISAPNDDTDYAGASGAIEINVGDVVVGIKNFRDTLVIFCKRSLKTLTGTTSADFTIAHVAGSIGSHGHDTIQEIGGDLVYLATDSIRSWAATERVGDTALASVSQNIQPIISNLVTKQYEDTLYSSLCVRNKGQYRLFVNNPDLSEADTIGILGRLTDTPVTPHGSFEWATIKGIKPYCADSDFSGDIYNNEIAVFGHPTTGYVYRMESGTDFDGVPMIAIYRSPDMTFNDATLRKVYQKIDLYTQVEGEVDTNLNLLLDRENTDIIQPQTINLMVSGAVPTYGSTSSLYDTSRYGIFYLPTFKRNLIGSGFFGAIQLSSMNSFAPYRIDSFQIQFTRKSRR